jgi:tetratricopeptide (TPR) repeat protein
LDLEERQRTVSDLLDEAEHTCSDYCFPNKTEDIAVLRFASDRDCPMAKYYLGNLYYDRRQWEEAVSLWEQAEKEKPEFPTVHRNLALAYYNKCGEPVRAREELEKAFALNKADARVFLELDQLYKKLGMSFADRLARYGEYPELVESRDDLYVEYVTLLNMTGQMQIPQV